MATTYKVYRDGAKVADGITEKTYKDTGLTASTKYKYEVSTVVDGAESAKSNAINVTTNAPPVVKVTGVTLTPENMALKTGATGNVTAEVAPSNATDKTITLSSSKTSVATVNGAGLVTAKAAGTATITVTTTDGAKTDACVVTVTDPVVAVTSITVTPETVSLAPSEGYNVTATVAPANATNKTYTSKTSDAAIATVSGARITGVAAGTATITFTTNDGAKTDTVAVTVAAEAKTRANKK